MSNEGRQPKKNCPGVVCGYYIVKFVRGFLTLLDQTESPKRGRTARISLPILFQYYTVAREGRKKKQVACSKSFIVNSADIYIYADP